MLVWEQTQLPPASCSYGIRSIISDDPCSMHPPLLFVRRWAFPHGLCGLPACIQQGLETQDHWLVMLLPRGPAWLQQLHTSHLKQLDN